MAIAPFTAADALQAATELRSAPETHTLCGFQWGDGPGLNLISGQASHIP